MHLPEKVRSERVGLALLSPLLDTNLRGPVAPRLWCTDASPSAGAVVHADLPVSAARELSPKDQTAEGVLHVDPPENEQ